MKVLFIALFVILSGCTHFERAENKKETNEVYLMAYNVENLFDTKHDQDKDDYAYLPLKEKQTLAQKEFCTKIKVKSWRDECLYKDWTEEKLNEKLKRLAGVILQFHGGQGPDILFLEEVENIGVLERLNKEYLSGAYQVVLIEGDDKRGIDVAIMSKLPISQKPILHKILFKFDDPKRAADTRGILEVNVALPDGTPLKVFGVHFPSPGHPAEFRTQALNYLNDIAKPSGDQYVVVAGDFNITSNENKQEMRTEQMSKSWLVSHAVGCKECVGTFYFRPDNNWSFLDWMLFSKNLDVKSKGWYLDKNSIRLIKGYKAQVDHEGHPVSFEKVENLLGVSDHLPLGAVLRKVN